MKKVQAFKCFCLIASLLFSTAYAEFEVVGSDGSSVTSGDGTTIRSTNPDTEREVEYTGTERNCTKSKNYAPFKLVRSLMTNPSDFKVEVMSKKESDDRNKAKLQVKVTMPPYYKSCMTLKFKPIKSKDQSLHVRMKMTGENDTYEKYIKCLEDKGILVNGQFLSAKSEISDVQHMLFDLDVDPGKNVDVFFDSPFPTSENGKHGYVFGSAKNVVSCFKSEDFEDEGMVLYKSPETEAAERAYTACTSKDHRIILGELERLRSAGNATSLLKNANKLESILNDALETARDEREKEIFDEMEAIAGEFKDYKKEGFREDDEDAARKSARTYVELVEELDEISIHPSVKMVAALLEKRKKSDTTKKEIGLIDDEIKRLNEVIGTFAKKNNKQLGIIYAGLEEYALIDEAIDIEGFRLKSSHYAKVSKRRKSGTLTLERARDLVKKKISHFETRTTADWEGGYLVKRGYGEPLNKTANEYQSALGRFKKDESAFKQNEAKLYKKYCQPSMVMFNQAYHQRRCQKYQASRSSRMQKYLKIRENQLGYISGRKTRYDEMNGWYQSGLKRRQAEMVGDQDPFGFYTYSPSSDLDIDSDFSMGTPMMPQSNFGQARSPASYSGGSTGYPIMGPMGGQNPYGQTQQPQGIMPQQGYFNGGYRGY